MYKYKIKNKNKNWKNLSLENKKNTPRSIIDNIQSWSSHDQDYFVLKYLNFKKNGFFIELGGR